VKDFFGWAVIGLGALGFVIFLGVASLWLITVIWTWVVPDIFRGAVAWGILPAALNMGQAFKLLILFCALGLGTRVSVNSSK